MSEPARVAVITGASAGVGLAAATALAAEGVRVIGIGRDRERSLAAEAQIGAAATGEAPTMLLADLSLLADAARLADKVTALTGRVHLLANNAGGMIPEPRITSEGLEACFAGNHLGPFVLTTRLLPLLRRAAEESEPGSVRIVNTSSDGSEMIAGINWDDLQSPLHVSPGASYCSGKLANVLFAKALAVRLTGSGIMAFSFHPGTVASNFFAHVSAATARNTAGLDKISPGQAAETLLYLARTPAARLENGGYYYRCAPRAPNPFALDPANVERLWRETETLVGTVPIA